MQELKIKRMRNGYHLSFFEDTGDTANSLVELVVEEPDDDNGETIAMQDLLYQVAEHFGYTYNKWGNNNLKISFGNKGHKLD